jgi:hypothetical protein
MPVAALVLREVANVGGQRFGMIGMVCVDPARRGEGLSGLLLENALGLAAEKEIPSLLLWTALPQVYLKHGFEPERCDSFGEVKLNSGRARPGIKFYARPVAASRGLPPFAHGLVRFQSESAEAIVLETAQGVAVGEWSGHASDVVDLLEAALPNTWRLNCATDDEILDEVKKRGHSFEPLPCAVRMARHAHRALTIPYISILDRI